MTSLFVILAHGCWMLPHYCLVYVFLCHKDTTIDTCLILPGHIHWRRSKPSGRALRTRQCLPATGEVPILSQPSFSWQQPVTKEVVENMKVFFFDKRIFSAAYQSVSTF